MGHGLYPRTPSGVPSAPHCATGVYHRNARLGGLDTLISIQDIHMIRSRASRQRAKNIFEMFGVKEPPVDVYSIAQESASLEIAPQQVVANVDGVDCEKASKRLRSWPTSPVIPSGLVSANS